MIALVIGVSLSGVALTALDREDFAFEIFGLGILFCVAATLVRSLRRLDQIPAIELHDDALILPHNVESAQVQTVPYETIKAASSRGWPPRDAIIVETSERAYVFPRASFVDPEAITIFFLQLRSRLERHPRGAQIVSELRHRENLRRRLIRARPRVTYSLLAVIVLVFIVQATLGESGDPIVSARLGGNLFERTLNGEWYRLFTANFIHGSRLHIYLNGLALFSLGGVIERLLGPWTYLTTFLLAGVGGALASALINVGPMSVGVSTALFGLFGALGVLHLGYRRELPVVFRQSGRWWIIIIGVNAALSIWIPMVDVAAHVGGLVVGAVVTYLALRWRGGFAQNNDRRLRGITVAISVLYLAAISQGVVVAASFDAQDRAAYADQIYNPRLRAELDRLAGDDNESQAIVVASILARSIATRGAVWLGGEALDLPAEIKGDGVWISSERDIVGGPTLWYLVHRGGHLVGLLKASLPEKAAGETIINVSNLRQSDDLELTLGCGDYRSAGDDTTQYWSLTEPGATSDKTPEEQSL